MTKVAITGSSGLIGGALAADLAADGHEVIRLVRGPAGVPGTCSGIRRRPAAWTRPRSTT